MTEPLTTPVVPELVKQKLEAFERLQDEFEASLHFVQNMHGQYHFTSFPVADSVRYLHALWVCECKDRLLSIFKNITRYEGSYCLELLRRWQDGDTASVVDFLNRKLDMLPFVDITRQIHEARYQLQNEGRYSMKLAAFSPVRRSRRSLSLDLSLDGGQADND